MKCHDNQGSAFIIFLIIVLCQAGCTLEPRNNPRTESQQYLDSLIIALDTGNFDRPHDPEKRDPSERIQYYLNQIEEDSIKNSGYFSLSYFYYKQNDSLNFRKWNAKSLQMAQKLADSTRIAESYWDLANFFSKQYQADSAFYYYNKAHNLYKSVGEDYHAARMLLNLAVIKKDIKDYTGSEISTIKAINTFKSLKKYWQLYLGYNNLGVLYNELEEYDLALRYHQKALKYQGFIEEEHLFKETSLNNIGVVYQHLGKFDLAEKSFNQALKNEELFRKNTRLYAMILDNWAYAKLSKNETGNIFQVFQRALEIRDSIGHTSGVISSHIHLAEYYSAKNKKNQALKHLFEADKIADETSNNRELLKISLLLSNLDKDNKSYYLERYIHLNDSLQKGERAVRNKFARIEFETDEFIAENRYLSEQRKWIIGGAGSVFSIILLVFVIWRQKSKNKKLELEQEQQKANEEIYNLLLTQQNKLEEGRHQEKERISRELHDGILGRLFGTRLMLESLHGKTDQESLDNKKKYLNDLRIIEKEIRTISHDLNKDFFSQIQSFLDVLQEYLDDQKKIGMFELIFINDSQISWDELSSEIKINVFRIFQEAINNINKHAEADLVSITCTKSYDHIEIIISDNGKGFEITDKSKGIGLKNIQSRITRLNGKFNLVSGQEGTQVELKIPIKYYQ